MTFSRNRLKDYNPSLGQSIKTFAIKATVLGLVGFTIGWGLWGCNGNNSNDISDLNNRVLQVKSYREQGKYKSADTLASYVRSEISNALNSAQSNFQVRNYRLIESSLDNALRIETTNNVHRAITSQ